MKSILIKNGHVIDPSQGIDEKADILVKNGIIQKLANIIDEKDAYLIDAKGLVITPGLIDMHTHLREPGREDEETIFSGTRAAAAGGFTSICCMPNTIPVCDSRTGVKYLHSRAHELGIVNVYPIASITVNQKGEEITEFGDLIDAGAVAFSDDGYPVMNAEIMRRALEYTAMFDVPILDHCEDLDLSNVGVMNSGYIQELLGLPGISSAAETTQVARDIELLEFFGGRLHICHISAEGSVHLIRRAKKRGVNITCEVTPHHLTLTDEIVKKTNFDTNTKVKPPLSSEEDRLALIKGLQDGTIDIIATDHAPHTGKDKDKVYKDAPFGMIGMETAISVLLTDLVQNKMISLSDMIEKMTINPARILKIDKGTLKEGAAADITIIDPEKKHIIRSKNFFSLSRNTPFEGKKCKGAIDTTIVAGELVFTGGKIIKDKSE
jgi:dihydroorotase